MTGTIGNDRDYVVVGATEQQMLDLGFKKVGADFPVFLDSQGDQYALARKERKVGAGYHGFETQFDPSVTLEDDLARRDLTLNSIAQDIETSEIVDPFGGVDDLKRGMLRHVSDAFREDPLRVIRLARFYARWPDFEISAPTIALCKEISLSGELNELAEERHWAELEKMFHQSKFPKRFFLALYAFESLSNCKFYKDLLGEISISHIDKSADAVKRLKLSSDDKASSFTALAAHCAEQKSNAIPLRTKKLTKNISFIREMKYCTNDVYRLIHQNRGFDNSPAMLDVMRTMIAGESAEMEFPIESQQLWTAVKISQRIKADKFLHLSGPEIGKALEMARKSEILTVVGA